LLRLANGENSNRFYQTEETPAAIISPKATIKRPEQKETFLYDIITKPGQTYIFIAK
jgi:alpha-L-fucosidase 2